MNKNILITGITGYVGMGIAKRLISEGFEVMGIIRDTNKNFNDRAEELYKTLKKRDKIKLINWDLEKDEQLNENYLNKVTHIIHSAAVTRFNVEKTLANSINVEGSRKIFELARLCPNLQCLNYISTIYSCGLVEGEILEKHHKTEDFANYYEKSKFDAENILKNEYKDLPWQIIRVATIISDNNEGIVTQQNAFHNTLKLFFYGLLSLVPGKKDTPLYFVTGQFVIDAIADLTHRFDDKAIYHLCHTLSESSTLGELLDLAYDRFNKEKDFQSRNILSPILCDLESFNLLAGETKKMGTTVMGQGMSSISPFSKQLFSKKNFVNNNLQSSIEKYSAPNPKDLLDSVCGYLVKTRWGKRAN